jgi:hypothetical protein
MLDIAYLGLRVDVGHGPDIDWRQPGKPVEAGWEWMIRWSCPKRSG